MSELYPIVPSLHLLQHFPFYLITCIILLCYVSLHHWDKMLEVTDFTGIKASFGSQFQKAQFWSLCLIALVLWWLCIMAGVDETCWLDSNWKVEDVMSECQTWLLLMMPTPSDDLPRSLPSFHGLETNGSLGVIWKPKYSTWYKLLQVFSGRGLSLPIHSLLFFSMPWSPPAPFYCLSLTIIWVLNRVPCLGQRAKWRRKKTKLEGHSITPNLPL